MARVTWIRMVTVTGLVKVFVVLFVIFSISLLLQLFSLRSRKRGYQHEEHVIYPLDPGFFGPMSRSRSRQEEKNVAAKMMDLYKRLTTPDQDVTASDMYPDTNPDREDDRILKQMTFNPRAEPKKGTRQQRERKKKKNTKKNKMNKNEKQKTKKKKKKEEEEEEEKSQDGGRERQKKKKKKTTKTEIKVSRFINTMDVDLTPRRRNRGGFRNILFFQRMMYPPGSRYFREHDCAVKDCDLSDDVVTVDTADVVVFMGNPPFGSYIPRHPWQIWVMSSLESPQNTQPFQARYAAHFNWTATYRHDSTLVTPYEKYVPLNRARLVRDYPLRDYAQGKTRMIAWFVSNCKTRNAREEYVRALSKHIPVDVFGSCGSFSCPRSKSGACSKLLNENYKFYLSFENTNCREYITEKFFVTGLQHDVIPIVMGAPQKDYEKVAPPHSFIHVDQFSSIRELASYLMTLDEDRVRYNEYFLWKGLWAPIDTLFPCRLCSLAHDVDRRGDSWYTDINSWWSPPGVCLPRGERWSRPPTEEEMRKDLQDAPEDYPRDRGGRRRWIPPDGKEEDDEADDDDDDDDDGGAGDGFHDDDDGGAGDGDGDHDDDGAGDGSVDDFEKKQQVLLYQNQNRKARRRRRVRESIFTPAA